MRKIKTNFNFCGTFESKSKRKRFENEVVTATKFDIDQKVYVDYDLH